MTTQAPAKSSAPSGPFGANAPSVTLPLRFVVTGVLALVVGAGLLLVRPDILATYHYNQYVIAATHLFVLGFICTIVMGAMYQLVPVALETRLFSERLARWQFVLHAVGFIGMVWMFWRWDMKQVSHFGSALTLGVGLFVYNIARTLARVPRWNVVATAVASSLFWLSAAVLAGLTIAAGKCTYESVENGTSIAVLGPLLQGLKTFPRFTAQFDQIAAMHAHAHLGAVGVFLMLIVGISYKLVPMFTLSDVQSPARARASILLLNLGLAGSFFTVLLRSPFKVVFAAVLVSAAGLYLWEMLAITRARKRRTLDWGLVYFFTAIALLVPVSVLGLVLAWPGLPLNERTGQLENLYGFLGLVGVVALAINGMLYKIVPFLVWYKTYSSKIGLTKVPALADLYSSRFQAGGYFLFVAGLAVSSIAIVGGHSVGVRTGCGLLAGSLLCLAVNMVFMLRHLIRPFSACERSPEKVPLARPAASTANPT